MNLTQGQKAIKNGETFEHKIIDQIEMLGYIEVQKSYFLNQLYDQKIEKLYCKNFCYSGLSEGQILKKGLVLINKIKNSAIYISYQSQSVEGSAITKASGKIDKLSKMIKTNDLNIDALFNKVFGLFVIDGSVANKNRKYFERSASERSFLSSVDIIVCDFSEITKYL